MVAGAGQGLEQYPVGLLNWSEEGTEQCGPTPLQLHLTPCTDTDFNCNVS